MSDQPIQIASLEPDGELFRRLRGELGVSSFGINLLTLRPKQRMRVHLHERQEEVYIPLEGELTLIVEGTEHLLGVGSVARVPAAAKRQLTNPGPERLVLLALGGSGDEHESRDARAWGSWEEAEQGEGRSPRDVPLPPDLP